MTRGDVSECAASPLLLSDMHHAMAQAAASYPPHYDEVFREVGDRLRANGEASKMDLAALLCWKHIQNAEWMRRLLETPDVQVRKLTAAALAPNLSDEARIAAISGLPGIGAGKAVTSVLFAAWSPQLFGVYDRFIESSRTKIMADACQCVWKHNLPVYWAHLRKASLELSTEDKPWIPREVDMAMFAIGTPSRKPRRPHR